MKCFEGEKATYITKGISSRIPKVVQLLLFCILEETKESGITMDYFQVFELKTKGDKLEISHYQEEPEYRTEKIYMPFDMDIDEKVYIIDSGENITMLLPSEY